MHNSNNIKHNNPNYEFYEIQKKICKDKCVGCFKLKELLLVKPNVAVDSMIRLFKANRNQRVSEEEIESWFDSIGSLKKIVSILIDNDISFGELSIVYGYKMPKDMMEPENGRTIYSVPLIVSKNSYILMEFKKEFASEYSSELKKFIKRLKYHEYGSLEKHRKQIYTVVSKSIEPIKHNMYFMGDAETISNHMISWFRGEIKPYENVSKWLDSNFVPKKTIEEDE